MTTVLNTKLNSSGFSILVTVTVLEKKYAAMNNQLPRTNFTEAQFVWEFNNDTIYCDDNRSKVMA